MKQKFFRLLFKYLNVNAIKMAILFVPLAYLLYRSVSQGSFALETFLDVGILVSFLFVAFCELLAGILRRWIGNKCEDATKLTEDYEALCKKYPREKFVMIGEQKCPVICLCLRKETDDPYEFFIAETEEGKRYELPAQIADRSDMLMQAHKYSKVYNNRNIRLDDLHVDGNKVSLFYSTTMYFDSLVTNRAMDYDWGNKKTNREVYEPGPFLNSLSESKLSNHLGFGGFVETSDGYLIFVMRYGKVSIGKRTLADSIGASLKTKYCLEDSRKFTVKGLDRAIVGEIRDELKIPVDENAEMSKHIVAFYRDVVEGGKPQFMFYYKCQWDAAKVKEEFKKALKEDKKKNKTIFATDGKKLVFIPRDELYELELTRDSLKRKNGKKYKMVASSVASVQMLKEFFTK